MESLWRKTELPEFPRLQTDLKTDVLIIGGGLAGLLCAFFLKNAGVDCVLVEENRICSGVTGNTTAKLTAQHGLIYSKLISQIGEERARLYYEANREALTEYGKLCTQADCDYSERDSFLYCRDDTGKLEAEMAALEKLKIPARWTTQTELPFSVTGAVCMPHQAQFHPLKFASMIARDLPVFENTAVRSFDGRDYHTDSGVIRAEKVIVATHFPMWNKHGLYPLKLYQDRSYVLALQGVKPIQGMYKDTDTKGLSFRMAGEYLLLGGGAHRTGKKGDMWQEKAAKKYYADAVVAYRWATQDCMSLDGIPYIGRYARNAENMYVATGFNKWGMTSAMVAARLLRDLIVEKGNPYAELFSPSRSMLKPQLFVNGFEATAHLLKPTVPRCPHMGCALQWNKKEHSWDCPCHGSRFSEEGKRLNGPATADMKNTIKGE